MKRATAMVVVAMAAMAGGCKGDKKADGTATPAPGEKATPAAGDPGAMATPPPAEGTGGEVKEKPALPSIGDDPSPARICARLAAAAKAEGGRGEVEWNHLASESTVFGRSVDQQRDTLVELTHEITVEPE